MMNKTFAMMFAFLVGLGFAGRARAQHAGSVIESGAGQLPGWLKQGKVRFARFDGGPIEIQKTRRSAWGMRFTPAEQKVLANVYGKSEYGARMADLLSQAHVNFVWVTYSVGFSWDDESPQRALVRDITRMLHVHGIRVAAYMDAHSIFWESMFRDVPESVRWITFDSQGLPYRYSSGRDAMRFIADLKNPGWVSYEERRIGAIIDDGLDGIFFDNTGDPDWSSDASVAAFFTKLREFIHNQKHSNIPLFSNFGLSPSRAALNRYMDFTFDEHWMEPGVWGDEWDVSNIRRTRYLRGLLPAWKPLITEYSIFHEGDRSTSFLKPRSTKLAIAEAASFGAAYTWDMEGPFDARLVTGDPDALASWSAIGQYNGFLANHEPLYVGARNVTPITVLLPDNFQPGFAWTSTSPLLDFLSKNSVLYDLKLASHMTARELAAYQGVIIPAYAAMSDAEKEMLRGYSARGGKVYAFGDSSDTSGLHAEVSSPEVVQKLADDPTARKEVQKNVAPLEAGSTRVELNTSAHVLANVTTVDQGRKLLLHLLNYDPKPVERLQVRLVLGKKFSGFAGGAVTLASPDTNDQSLKGARWSGDAVDISLPSLDVYSVVFITLK